jgi:hypothetical protein
MRLSGWLLTLGIVASSLAAGAVALQRLRVEQANRAVEVVLDYPDVAQWASAEGKTVADWLRSFSTPFSIALTEGTLAEWGMPVAAPTPTYLLSEVRFQQAKRIFALKARVELQPPQDAPAVEVRSPTGARFWVVGDPLTLTQLGLGLDPVQVAQVRAGGKPIVARLINPQGITPLALRGSLLFAREQGASLLIFAVDQVLGYRPGLQATAHNIRANAMRFGAIEFAKQAGAGNLSQAIPTHTVRVHSIGACRVAAALAPRDCRAAGTRRAGAQHPRAVPTRGGRGHGDPARDTPATGTAAASRGLRDSRVGRASVRRVAAPHLAVRAGGAGRGRAGRLAADAVPSRGLLGTRAACVGRECSRCCACTRWGARRLRSPPRCCSRRSACWRWRGSRGRVRKAADSESPLTPALSPLEKGGEGTGVGESNLLAAFA